MYSPGIIFSNQVAALKVDFVGQTEEYSEVTYSWSNAKNYTQLKEIYNQAKAKSTEQKLYFNIRSVQNVYNAVATKVVNNLTSAEKKYIAKEFDADGWDWTMSNATECYQAFRRMYNKRFQYVSDWEKWIMTDGSWVVKFKNGFKRAGIDEYAFLAGELELDSLPSNLSWSVIAADGKGKDVEYYNICTKLPFSNANTYDGQYQLFDEQQVGILDSEMNTYYDDDNFDGIKFVATDDDMYFIWRNNVYYAELVQKMFTSNKANIYYYSIDGFAQEQQVFKKTNTDYALKPYVSKWYNALRTVALVGLLSVLVYIGIRIILSSSSAQDKAKYKNMLKEWVVAICLLFMLHYIMAFMLKFNQALNDIFIDSALEKTAEGNYTDSIMNTLRARISDTDNISSWDTGGYTLMWLVMVILTGTFTFQYLKRVIYMAFLTMIAPMIALTYPLDKIKDGKAQAFSFWLKEYIFQCLIQPVHLLLYSMLIGSAIDFAKENMIYALVAMGFLVPAEKLIKQMFGMKSETSAGNFSAAVGGAAVMNMMNKLRGAGPKGGGNQGQSDEQSGGGQSGGKGVRTTNNRGGANPTSQGGATTSTNSQNSSTTTPTSSGGNALTSTQNSQTPASTSSSSTSAKGSKLRGVGNVAKRAMGGPKGIKYRGRKLGGAIVGAAGATIGVAATIARRRCLKIRTKRCNRIWSRKCSRRESSPNRNGFKIQCRKQNNRVWKCI